MVHHDRPKPCRVETVIPLWLQRRRHEFLGDDFPEEVQVPEDKPEEVLTDEDGLSVFPDYPGLEEEEIRAIDGPLPTTSGRAVAKAAYFRDYLMQLDLRLSFKVLHRLRAPF